MNYAREALAKVLPEMQALTEAHWQEVAHDKSTRTLDPDWSSMQAMEDAGQFYVLTARDAGVLMGYMLGVIRPHLHSKGTLAAYVDAIFLAKEARKGMVGARFIRYTDMALTAMGADFIYWHCKPEKDFSPILQRSLGYHFIESIWGRAVQRAGV